MIAFATSGGYIAFFHTTKYVLYNFAVAASVALVEAIRLASSGHVALAGVDLWLVAGQHRFACGHPNTDPGIGHRSGAR